MAAAVAALRRPCARVRYLPFRWPPFARLISRLAALGPIRARVALFRLEHSARFSG